MGASQEIFLLTQRPPRTPHCQTNLPHQLTRQTFVQGICSAKSNPCTCLSCLGTKKKRSRCSVGRFFLLGPSRGNLLANAEPSQNTALPNEPPTSTHQANFCAGHLLRKKQPMHLPYLPRDKKEALSLQCGALSFSWTLLGEICLSTQSSPRTPHCQTNFPHQLTRQTLVQGICSARGNPCTCLSCLVSKKKRSRCSVGRFLSAGRFSGRFSCQRRALPGERIAKRTSHIYSPGKLRCEHLLRKGQPTYLP